MKKILLSLFFGLIVIPAAVVATIYQLNKNGFFSLDHIEITVENEAYQEQFQKPLVADLDRKMEAYRGKSLWDLDLGEISKVVSRLKWVENVYLSRSWPTRLNVRVIAKDIQLLYVNKAGLMFPVVAEGQLLDGVTSKEIPDVVLLHGDVFEKDKEMRKRAVNLIAEIPAEGKFSKKNISELRFDQKEGFWATLIQSGIRVKIGEEQVPLRANRVSQVLEYMEGRQIEARVIDANLSKKVLVRLRKAP